MFDGAAGASESATANLVEGEEAWILIATDLASGLDTGAIIDAIMAEIHIAAEDWDSAAQLIAKALPQLPKVENAAAIASLAAEGHEHVQPLLARRLRIGWEPDLVAERVERPLISNVVVHAEQLLLPHPVTGATVTITAPWPRVLNVAVKYLRRYASLSARTQPCS